MTALYWKSVLGIVAAVAVTAAGAWGDGPKPGSDPVGGTILIYEIDLSRFPEGKLPADFDAKVLAERLKKRIDPADLFNLTVRPQGPARIEIILPTAGEKDRVQRVKDRIAQTGALEFVIVANEGNDKTAIEEALKHFAAAGKAERTEIDKRALTGAVPPPPGGGKKFETKLGDFSYRWVELGPGYCQERGLGNPRDRDDQPLAEADVEALLKGENVARARPLTPAWRRAAEARAKGQAILLDIDTNHAVLLYSRKVGSPRAAERRPDRRYEYFLLVREAAAPSKRITGEDADKVVAEEGGVHLHFTTAAADRFHDLTSRNRDQLLAIVLDGAVQSAPTIREAIHSDVRITGSFTREQIDRMVNILRSGALPATLKPEPVSETTIGPAREEKPGK